jgi:hypothetical protein
MHRPQVVRNDQRQSRLRADHEILSGGTMSADLLLSKLERVRRTGPGRWIARCPAHADRSPSMSVRELDDGRILIHDHAGCDVHSILAAVGLDVSALFPGREILHGRPELRPFPAADVLRCVAFESMVVAMAGTALLDGRPFGEVDRARMMLAISRLQAATSAAGLRHD